MAFSACAQSVQPEAFPLSDVDAIQGQYPNVLRAVLAMPWAIDHESVAWAAIVDVLALRAAGQGLTDEEISARVEAAQNGPRQGRSKSTGVGIYTLPIYGVITPRGNIMARSSGGTTAESILNEFRAAMADPDVDGIVFDMDSPGGAVEGIDELAAEIRAARGQKPIVAVANYMAASAAYWIASAADEIVASPSAMVGSIGVFTAHDDISEAQAKLGIKRTVISAGKHKAEGALGQPLSDEARAHVQEQVDEHYAAMTSAIAKGRTYGDRKVTQATVKGESYGEGRGVMAKKALAAGMIDHIDTLENTVRRVAKSVVSTQRHVALTDPTQLAALVTALPFSDRLALATGLASDLANVAQTRAASRAEDGRRLSAAARSGISDLALSLAAIAGDGAPDPDEEDEDDDKDPAVIDASPESEQDGEPKAPETDAKAPSRRADLEVLEAATRGGYALPN